MEFNNDNFKLPKSFHEPPYDSPIEDEFSYWLHKYVDEDTFVIPQFEIKTYYKAFRIDFVLEKDNKFIGIECDGAKYHKLDNDTFRDAIILSTKKIECLFRLRGKDIFNKLNDCLYIISKYSPQYFNERGRKNIETLASDFIKKQFLNISLPFQHIKYEVVQNEDNDEQTEFDMEALEQEDIWIDIKRFTDSKYYYYNLTVIWEIIKFKELYSLNSILEYFKDLPKRIDEHNNLLRSFNKAEFENYKNKLIKVEQYLKITEQVPANELHRRNLTAEVEQ